MASHEQNKTGSANRRAEIEKLAALIRDIRVALLTTVAEDGMLRTRPITTMHARFDGDLWFVTKRGSAKAQEVRDYDQVCLGYANTEQNTYVSVSGKAEVIQDPRKAEELWDESYRGWFQGPNDPSLALIRIKVERAEYWDAPADTWTTAAGFVVMSAGELPGSDSHAKIDLTKQENA